MLSRLLECVSPLETPRSRSYSLKDPMSAVTDPSSPKSHKTPPSDSAASNSASAIHAPDAAQTQGSAQKPAAVHTPATLAALHAARQRIGAAYNPAAFQQAGERVIATLSAHLRSVQHSETVVIPWSEPQAKRDLAAAELDRADRRVSAAITSPQLASNPQSTPQPIDLPAETQRLVRLMLDHAHNLHDPRYIGHQVPPPVPFAGLFETVGSVINNPMAVYEMGPWAVAAEAALVDKLAGEIGWKVPPAGGLLTHGASLANLTAMLAARNVLYPNAWTSGLPRSGPAPVFICSRDAHYCIVRSAGILGMGTDQVIKAPLDAQRSMDVNWLDETLADLSRRGVPVIAVAASACSTPIGAFDPIASVAEICQRHNVWLHIDAAHGGAVLFSEQHKHLLAGCDQADSITWDAHKMLFMPALCAFLFYKKREHGYLAFQQQAPYLFDAAADRIDFDVGLRTVECTKRSQSFCLWGTWSLFGRQIFTDLVDVTFATAREFHAMLHAADDFEPLHDPQCNIVVFRYLPDEIRAAPLAVQNDFQQRLRKVLIESGEYYIVPNMLDGMAALRCTVMNPLTTTDHLAGLLDALRRHGRALIPTAANA